MRSILAYFSHRQILLLVNPSHHAPPCQSLLRNRFSTGGEKGQSHSPLLHLLWTAPAEKKVEAILPCSSICLRDPLLLDTFFRSISIISSFRRKDMYDVELLRYTKMEEEVASMLQVGLTCIAEEPQERPHMLALQEEQACCRWWSS